MSGHGWGKRTVAASSGSVPAGIGHPGFLGHLLGRPIQLHHLPLPALISVKATVYSAAEQRSVTFSWQSAFLALKPYPLNAFGHPGAAYVEENLKSLEELMSCRTIHDCLALRRMA